MSSTYIGQRGPFRKSNRSAYANFLRAKYEMFTAAETVSSYPYILTLDPSDVCQLRCPTCPTGIENQSRRDKGATTVYRGDRQMLGQDLFDAVLDELGEYLFLIVFYDWGEPLLNQQLPSYIRSANQREIETEINTNLSLRLSDRYIDDLLSSGLDYIEVSIDGFTQETYEIHRRGGNLALVKENLKRFANARTRLGLSTAITYNFIVFSHNEHEIKQARRYATELGLHFNTREAFTDDPTWLPSHRKNEAPLLSETELDELAAAGDTPRPHYLRWSPLGTERGTKAAPACGWHYGSSVITSGGPVQPCCAVAHEADDFGMVVPGKTKFSDVWNNARYRSARAAFAGKTVGSGPHVESACTRCRFPTLMQHMYSLHDMKVLAQFDRVFGATEPALDAGFRLLGRARYGRIVQALYRRGIFWPLVQAAVGLGDERQTEAFVDFYEKHLLSERTALSGGSVARSQAGG